MVLELFACLVLDFRLPTAEQIMNYWPATKGSGYGAWRFDANERVDSPRDPFVVFLRAVRSRDVLHDDISEGAGGVIAHERHVDTGGLHAGLWHSV